MIINHIKIHTIHIPFKFPINHNLKNRANSESVILAVHTESGKIGYGEGVPCSYVTGKSTQEIIFVIIHYK